MLDMQITKKCVGTVVVGTSLGLLLSGCQHFLPYRIDVAQGVPLTQAQVAEVQVGMTAAQVRGVLGAPSVVSGQQWFYYFNFQPGTNAKREHIGVSAGQQFIVEFDAGRVVRMAGTDTVAQTPQRYPLSNSTLR